ncbi:MAG: VOC family protein [Pseudomonadota bacterium]
MDYETVSADDFGASLKGLGLNILVKDVKKTAGFLTGVFGIAAHRVTADFAIMTYEGQVFQLHHDGTYGAHPLLGVLPEAGVRGAGAQFHLFATDPDVAASKAEDVGGHILDAAKNKPHGLREVFIMDPDGYVWVASRPLTQEERDAL